MNADDFQTLLSTHGADLERWPLHARISGRTALRRFPELSALIVSEAELERRLAQRAFEPPSDSFCERIIAAAALHAPASPQRFRWILALQRLLDDIAPPKPAFTLGAIMLLGAVLGYASNVGGADSALQASFGAMFTLNESVL